MVSVERVQQYSEIEPEGELQIVNCKPEDVWPEYGEIIGENVEYRYHSSLQPVLKGINFHIKPKEKVLKVQLVNKQ